MEHFLKNKVQCNLWWKYLNKKWINQTLNSGYAHWYAHSDTYVRYELCVGKIFCLLSIYSCYGSGWPSSLSQFHIWAKFCIVKPWVKPTVHAIWIIPNRTGCEDTWAPATHFTLNYSNEALLVIIKAIYSFGSYV